MPPAAIYFIMLIIITIMVIISITVVVVVVLWYWMRATARIEYIPRVWFPCARVHG